MIPAATEDTPMPSSADTIDSCDNSDNYSVSSDCHHGGDLLQQQQQQQQQQQANVVDDEEDVPNGSTAVEPEEGGSAIDHEEHATTATTTTTAVAISSLASNDENRNNDDKPSPSSSQTASVPRGTSVANSVTNVDSEKKSGKASELTSSSSSTYREAAATATSTSIASSNTNKEMKSVSFDEQEEDENQQEQQDSTTDTTMTTTMADDNSQNHPHHQQQQQHLEPEGVRRNTANNVSRRFDEAILKQVMVDDDNDDDDKDGEEKKQASEPAATSNTSTIMEEEEEDEHEHEVISGTIITETRAGETDPQTTATNTDTSPTRIDQNHQNGSININNGTQAFENERGAITASISSSRKPPGTPARRPEDDTKQRVSAFEALLVPSLPSPMQNYNHNTASTTTRITEEMSSLPQQQPVAAIIDTSLAAPQNESPLEVLSHSSSITNNNNSSSYHHYDDQQSLHSMTLPPPPQLQSFAAHVPEHVMHAAAPLAAVPIAPAHMQHHTATTAVATTNGFHNHHPHPNAATANGLLAYPNGEVGIPHMPPLVVPSTNSSYHGMSLAGPSSAAAAASHTPGGKRRIQLRLVEDVANKRDDDTSLFSSFRRRSILRKSPASPIDEQMPHLSSSSSSTKTTNVDRGTLTVSWYEGTSSLELQEHVRNSVVRKLRLEGTTTKLADFRILDDSVDPPEEIVLCPYIPNGSTLLLRFTTKDAGGDATPMYPRIPEYGPPESPSAAPSPHPKMVDLGGLGLNANQLALLGSRLKGLQMPPVDDSNTMESPRRLRLVDEGKPLPAVPSIRGDGNGERNSKKNGQEDDEDNSKEEDSNMEVASLHPEDPVQKSLREITELLITERKGNQRYAPRQEKRQVIFVLANYFLVFLSMIAIAAEIGARAPSWQASIEQHFQNVKDCSKDKESLFECVENGDLAGLIASVLLWISRSAATKRIFLFGFETPKKLWTVVYESLVTAVCWGFSYMFIRRGLNPDTNRNFLQRYWKDAVYGSLAGFNAAFMKHVLKNLIPQEAIEDALQERQLKILSWLPSFS